MPHDYCGSKIEVKRVVITLLIFEDMNEDQGYSYLVGIAYLVRIDLCVLHNHDGRIVVPLACVCSQEGMPLC